MKTLSQIFNDEAQANGQAQPFGGAPISRPTVQLSAAGGSNDHDADQSEKLKLLRKIISEKKICRKDDGSPYGDHELLAMPLETLQKLYDSTPSDDKVNATGEPKKASPTVNLSASFQFDNALTLLSARLNSSSAEKDDAARYGLIREFAQQGKVPLKGDGFSFFTDKELAEMPVATLKTLLVNTQPNVRRVC